MNKQESLWNKKKIKKIRITYDGVTLKDQVHVDDFTHG